MGRVVPLWQNYSNRGAGHCYVPVSLFLSSTKISSKSMIKRSTLSDYQHKSKTALFIDIHHVK